MTDNTFATATNPFAAANAAQAGQAQPVAMPMPQGFATPPAAAPVQTAPPVEQAAEEPKPKRTRKPKTEATETVAGTEPIAEAYQPVDMTPPAQPAPTLTPFPSFPAPAGNAPAMPANVSAFPAPTGGGAFPVPGQPSASANPAPTTGGFPVPGAGQAAQAPAADPAALPGGFNPYAGQGPAASTGLGDDFEIDLTGVQSGGGQDYIGPGTHLMYCSGVSDDVSQAGNRMIVFRFTALSGEFVGKSKNLYCTLTEKALFKLDETLLALGVIGTEGARKPTYGQIKAGAMRRIVIGEFTASTYNGRPSSDFNRVRTPEEMGIKPGTTVEQAQSGAR